MTTPVIIEIEMPSGLDEFRLPEGLHNRLQELLDQQDQGQTLTPEEHQQAQELVDMAEWFSLLRLKAQRLHRESASSQ